MPLSLFHHETLSHYREGSTGPNDFGHTFGGDPIAFGIRFANSEPLHLLYRLNQADPAANLGIPGINWLLLFYHFSYASNDGRLIYRVLNDTEIELLAPTDAEFDPDFPYPNYPRCFPQSAMRFVKQPYDPRVAEDALRLAGIFGVDQLSDPEMKKAVKIVGETSSLFTDWASGGGTPGVDFPNWSPEELVRYEYNEPFMQGTPSKECRNPNCTAKVKYRTEPEVIQMPDEYARVFGLSSFEMEARDVREDSMRVFAVHQPNQGDRLLWNDSYVQLIFQICECCHSICVSNQCD
jgi:hypothetical protein